MLDEVAPQVTEEYLDSLLDLLTKYGPWCVGDLTECDVYRLINEVYSLRQDNFNLRTAMEALVAYYEGETKNETTESR